jgi:hypothetical protein
MVADLIKQGCVPAKSHVVQFPTQIHQRLISHFIRGVFDGDGCARKDGSRVDICGNHLLLRPIATWLNKYAGMPLATLTRHGSINRITYSGRISVLCFRLAVYKRARDYLERKQVLVFSGIPKYRGRVSDLLLTELAKVIRNPSYPLFRSPTNARNYDPIG